MRLVTVATHSDGYYNFLMKSCKRFNTKIDVLGYGEKWQGLAWKMHLMEKYLKDIDNEDEIICFIDAYDVIMLRPLDELEKLFRLVGVDIIIGHEKHVSPLIHMLGLIIYGKDGLNSGTYIGYKSAISKMLKSYTTPDSDDQVLITNYARENTGKIHVDKDSIFFLTIANQLSNFDIDSVIIKDKTLTYKGLRPFFAHGCGNTNMNSLIEKLDYKMTLYEKNKAEQWNYDSSIKKIYYYCKNYTIYLVLLILIICLLVYYSLKLIR
jgi:hypothetical protein